MFLYLAIVSCQLCYVPLSLLAYIKQSQQLDLFVCLFVLVDAILNQKEINARAKSESEKLYCVYVAIGQKRSTVVRLCTFFVCFPAFLFVYLINIFNY